MMKAWKIYCLCDPSGEVRYIGFTTQRVHTRFKKHLHSATGECKPYPVCRWIRKLASKGCRPLVFVIDSGAGESWQARERFWIAYFRERSEKILNLSDGGRTVAATPARQLANKRLKTRVFTEDHRRKISESKRGKPRPDMVAFGRKMAENNRGKKMNLSDAERARRSAAGVLAIANAREGNLKIPSEVRSAGIKKFWAELSESGREDQIRKIKEGVTRGRS